MPKDSLSIAADYPKLHLNEYDFLIAGVTDVPETDDLARFYEYPSMDAPTFTDRSSQASDILDFVGGWLYVETYGARSHAYVPFLDVEEFYTFSESPPYGVVASTIDERQKATLYSLPIPFADPYNEVPVVHSFFAGTVFEYLGKEEVFDNDGTVFAIHARIGEYEGYFLESDVLLFE